jgi:hypothetical protein
VRRRRVDARAVAALLVAWGPRVPGGGLDVRLQGVSPSWVWLQGAIVVFVLAGMVIAIVKLS